jgi:tetrahydromethanopterin S-methyltransferase subunit B
MIIYKNKSDSESITRLHHFLYENDNQEMVETEKVAELYEDLDREFVNIHKDVMSVEEQMEANERLARDVINQLQSIARKAKLMKREKIIADLELAIELLKDI